MNGDLIVEWCESHHPKISEFHDVVLKVSSCEFALT